MYAPKPDSQGFQSSLTPPGYQYPPQPVATGHPPPVQYPIAPPQPVATGHPPPVQYPIAPPHPEIQQHYQPYLARPAEWTTGLFDCGQDPVNCCLTFWCPCVTFGQIAEIVDEGSPSCAITGGIYGLLLLLTGCACCFSCIYRTKMRAKFNLPELPCGDCPLHCCCEWCALCQEYRELKHKGYDPALGWAMNLQNQRQQQGMGISMAAPVGQPMSR